MTPRFALCVVKLKRCDRLCHNLRLGVGLVRECLILDKREENGGGAVDNAYVRLSSPSLAADGQGYDVAGGHIAVSIVEAQELQSRGSEVTNGTFLGGIGCEIEVAKVVCGDIREIGIVPAR